MDQIDRLERLAKLRADGALTEEEYQAQKAIVLQAGAPPASPAPSPPAGPPTPPPVFGWPLTAGGVIEGPPPKNRNAQILAVSLALLAVVLVGALLAWRLGPLAKLSTSKSDGALAVARAQPAAASAPGSEPTKEQAFALVYPGVVTLPSEEEHIDVQVQFRPLLLHRLNDNTYVLLSVGKALLDDLCHPCSGYYSIAYFTRSPTLTLQGDPFVREGSMGGWGQPPELALLKTLGPQPMVLARSGVTEQGVNEDSADLVLLGPTVSDVLVLAEHIPLSIGDAGNGGHCDIEGTIRPGVVGESFIIRFTGTFTGDVVYRRSGKTYKPPPGTPDVWDRCPAEPTTPEQ